jgi:hypothetical protein
LQRILNDPLNTRGSYSDGQDDRLPDTVSPHEVCLCYPQAQVCVYSSELHAYGAVPLHQVRHQLFHTRRRREWISWNLGERAARALRPDVTDLVAFLATLDGPGPDPALLSPP